MEYRKHVNLGAYIGNGLFENSRCVRHNPADGWVRNDSNRLGSTFNTTGEPLPVCLNFRNIDGPSVVQDIGTVVAYAARNPNGDHKPKPNGESKPEERSESISTSPKDLQRRGEPAGLSAEEVRDLDREVGSWLGDPDYRF